MRWNTLSLLFKILLVWMLLTFSIPPAFATNTLRQPHIEIIAKADMIPGSAGAEMRVYLNGSPLQKYEVRNSSWQSFRIPFSAGKSAINLLDIHFTNDHSVGAYDRNLWIREVRHLNQVMVPSVRATYDVGDSYQLATDDKNVRPGTQLMPWNGALRFKWPSTSGSQSGEGTAPQTRHTSAPVIMASGQVLSGKRIPCVGDRPAVIIPAHVHGVTIEDNEIGPCGSGIVGIYAEPGSYDINIRKNVIHGVASGFWANHSSHPIAFEYNQVYDVLGPFPRGQMIQLDNVKKGSGQTRIIGNVSDWFARTQPTKYEDHINTYMSSGTKENPILIQGNKFRGGDSDTGGAITIGDQGGKWYDVFDNVVVAVPNTGIAMVGGGHFRTFRNRVYNVYGPMIKTASAMTVWSVDSVELTSNRLLASYCDSAGFCDLHMGFWFGPGSLNVISKLNNWFDKTLTADIWKESWNGSKWVTR